MTSMLRDPYPSRALRETFLLQRKDPVIWADTPAPDWLCKDLVNHYAQNGYVEVQTVFSECELNTLLTEVQDDRLRYEAAANAHARYDQVTGKIRSVLAPHVLNPFYESIVRHPFLIGFAEHVLGSKTYLHQSRLNFADAYDNESADWHSDFETWHIEDGMPRMRAVACLILLAECNECNGPMMVIPKSHTQYIGVSADDALQFRTEDDASLQGCTPPKPLVDMLFDMGGGHEAIKGQVGTVVFYDCNLLHAIGSNTSPLPRSHLRVVYNSVENTLKDPCAHASPRPEYLAHRETALLL